ncbi:MAG: sigma-54 dependent transcriptional regulator [candidate division Zixibacteria bacterium]|nr:sigma-54 dependent transcriptional regulator [candidate division Zixibacteria bacterium]
MNLILLSKSSPAGSADLDWGSLGMVIHEVSEAYQVAKERLVDLILVDEHRHDVNMKVATRIRRNNGLTDVWRLTSSPTVDSQMEDFFDGSVPLDLGHDGIKKKIKRILHDKETLRRYGIVGRSPAIRELARTISRVAPTDVSVLVVGPSGSGKELVARALHEDSGRSQQPFVAVNCGALAEGVLESELFGHEKGAFTGSVGKREGLFFKAEGGTIFLDEIGETKPDMQVKLLRVLEDGTYYPVGSSVPRRADVRVLAATNRDLIEAISERTFREDLYYRISAVKLIVPSLLERKGDIQSLLQFFWRDQTGLDYTDSALAQLMKYDWPGNVRQLKNFVSRMAALKPTGLVDAADVDRFLAEQHSTSTHLPVSTGRTPDQAGQELIYRAILSLGNEIRHLRNLIVSHLPSEVEIATGDVNATAADHGSTMEDMEKALIEQVLEETGGNRKETARKLGIGERTLYRKLKKYDLK